MNGSLKSIKSPFFALFLNAIRKRGNSRAFLSGDAVNKATQNTLKGANFCGKLYKLCKKLLKRTTVHLV